MNLALEFLHNRNYLARCYEQSFAAVRTDYGLTQLEIDILAFLKNNPARDTASDIVQYRLISKANVSQAVEQLIQKGLLRRQPDHLDRRKVHLLIQASAAEPVGEILAAQRRFEARLLAGLSPEDLDRFRAVSRRMIDNAKKEWE